MENPLRIIEGMIVTEADTVHDYVQLAFGREIGISIYNNMEILPGSISLGTLVGKSVSRTDVRDDLIEIEFAYRTILKVDMRPDAYRGPEALQLNRVGHLPVIWN